ncbi:hypothetical protein GF407_16975 [candidate division KSB1 bacterium]|nr:hypothetical protein [candidate division KSB1 bacterium]
MHFHAKRTRLGCLLAVFAFFYSTSVFSASEISDTLKALRVGETFTIVIDEFSGGGSTTQPKTDANDGENGDNPYYQRHNVARAHVFYWYSSSHQEEGEPDPAGEQWVDYTPPFENIGRGIFRIEAQYREGRNRATYPAIYEIHHRDGITVEEQVQHIPEIGGGAWLTLGEFEMDGDDYVRVIDTGDRSISFGEMKFTKVAEEVIEPFSFSVTADIRQYAGSDYHTADYYKGACDQIAAKGPGNFMLCMGDMDPVLNIHWTVETVLGSDYTFYPVVGNHDIERDSDLLWLRNHNANGNTLPNIVNPGPPGCEETTYSFDYQNVHFVVLNQYFDGTSDRGTNGDVVDALYLWLEDDLDNTTRQHIIVCGHEPAYPQPDQDNGRARHLNDSLNEHEENRDRFWNLLSEYRVAAYFCGHTHNFSAIKIDNVWQLDAGHARGQGDTGAPSTFFLVHVNGDSIRLNVYRDTHDGNYDYDDLTYEKYIQYAPAYGIIQISLPGYYVDKLHVDDDVYFDRNYKIVSASPELLQIPRIVTANDHKTETGDDFLRFTIQDEAEVYVGYDSRITTLPSWLSSWTDSGLAINTTDTDYRCYRKHYPAGEVILGANEGGGSESMYMVMVKFKDEMPPSAPTGVEINGVQ